MRTSNSKDITGGSGPQERLLIGCAAGLLAGLVMNLFLRTVTGARGGREAAGAAPGDDRVGRGAQPPQAKGRAQDDATVRLGTLAYSALTGEEPTRATRSWLGTTVHYAFSGAVGAFYTAASPHVPMIRVARGVAYGTAVWILADEMMIPLLGLSRGPRELPPGVHAYAVAGHWVYGLALDSAARSLNRQLGSSQHS
jgi:hypothetical protein